MPRYSGSNPLGGYHLTPWVKRLIIANAVVYIATLAMPWLVEYLAFQPSAVLMRPWTIVTYMFTHANFWHVFFNMLMLFFFGPPVEERWGSKEFIKYYAICGLGAAALSFLLAFNNAVVGASGAVFGIMLAFAMLWPDLLVYIWGILPIKAKYLVFGLAAFDLISALPGLLAQLDGRSAGMGDGVAHFAHLGGFAAGFLYIKIDPATGNPFQKLRKLATRRRFKVVPGSSPPPPREPPRPKRHNDDPMLDDVDRVLDKISTQGMASLTSDERKLLDDMSKRYRQN